jgi:hypothetical protein
MGFDPLHFESSEASTGTPPSLSGDGQPPSTVELLLLLLDVLLLDTLVELPPWLRAPVLLLLLVLEVLMMVVPLLAPDASPRPPVDPLLVAPAPGEPPPPLLLHANGLPPRPTARETTTLLRNLLEC